MLYPEYSLVILERLSSPVVETTAKWVTLHRRCGSTPRVQ